MSGPHRHLDRVPADARGALRPPATVATPPFASASAGDATGRRRWLHHSAALGVAALLAGCGRKGPTTQAVPVGSTVLVLGDSLTSGVGATSDTAFPARLQAHTGWKVVNGGVSGDASAQALARLPSLLAQHKPALVIVSIGGNDFLRRLGVSQTRQNVQQICADALAQGAQVLLVAVPELSLMALAGKLSDHPLYADIARELQIPLHGNGWSQVLANDAWRADSVHPNAAGYEAFTASLLQTLTRTGLYR